jgi:hypothetical protein
VLVDSGAEIDRRHKALCRDLSLCNSDTRAGDALMCAAHIVYLRCGVAGTRSIRGHQSLQPSVIIIFIFTRENKNNIQVEHDRHCNHVLRTT